MNDTLDQPDLTLAEKEEAIRLAAIKLRAWQTKKALQSAPELAWYMRSQIARQERGEVLDALSAPLMVTIEDDADDLFARLVEWVTYWSRLLETMPTATSVVAWWTERGPLGFKAGVSPRGAAALVNLQTSWLLQRQHRMALVPAPEPVESEDGPIVQASPYEVFQDDIVKLLGAMRGRYPMRDRPEPPVQSRPCPLCGEYAVTGQWWSHDAEVLCTHCGWKADPKDTRRILQFIEDPEPRRELTDKIVRFTMPGPLKNRKQVFKHEIQELEINGNRYSLIRDETGAADVKTELIVKPEPEGDSNANNT